MKENKKYGGKKEITLVNSVTGLRFLASFLIIPTFKALGGTAAAFFAVIFSLTDWIDGFLARKLKSSTFFGSIFDGVSDKAFGITILGLLMTINPIVFSLPLLLELGIFVTQINKAKKGLNVKSNMIGKVKMWSLCITSIASFLAVDILNMPFILDYLKDASLDKIAGIKDFLVLLGINLPTIVLQGLTMGSYKEELIEEEKVSDEIPPDILATFSKEDLKAYIAKQSLEDQKILKEYFADELKEDIVSPEERLMEIQEEKEKLQEEYTFLEKAKIIKEKLFDPEYYDKNKERQIRVLTKELFTKER